MLEGPSTSEVGVFFARQDDSVVAFKRQGTIAAWKGKPSALLIILGDLLFSR
jgi:hypothetical protein